MILWHEKIDTTMTYVYMDKESVKTHIKNFLIDKKDIKCQKLQVVNM